MNIAKYAQKAGLTTAHKTAIFQTAKLFLSKLANFKPSEIITDAGLLFKVMRDDYISQNMLIEKLVDRIQKLEEANAKQENVLQSTKAEIAETFNSTILKLNESNKNEVFNNKEKMVRLSKKMEDMNEKIG